MLAPSNAASPAYEPCPVVLLAIEAQSKADFFSNVCQNIDQSTSKEALIFVHGYNVSFEEASRRTAQMAYDLKFSGAPILYSWPSAGNPEAYPADEASAEWSTFHFKIFLKEVAEHCGSSTIHIIAHSMGNRLLASALYQLNLEQFVPPTRFHQIVLAAPDIDASVLRQLSEALKSAGQRITLYASASDKALILSRKFHEYPRAGEFIFPMMGIDVIDASAVDTNLIGHSYYGDNRSVLSDIFWLIHDGEPPSSRFGMSVVSREDGTYYAFLP
jgi:esterase/lipase superfamily enzyme